MAVVPVFYFDLSSPYAYLAATRVDEVLGTPARWEPIVFGAVLRAAERVPWSLREETREPGMRAVEQRAAERGLPPVRWPRGWPAESYSVEPLRAVLWARERGLDRALTLELYREAFVHGRALDDPEAVRAAARRAGLEAEALGAGIAKAEIKARLREGTERAIERGVTGVPTVAVEDRLFWGDDRLEDAAGALRAAGA